MKHTTTRQSLALAGTLFLLLLGATPAAFAQASTAFTYQGRLTDNGATGSGAYDLQFALFDAGSDGTQQGALVNRDDVVVTNGVFTVHLDFGSAPFATGAPRFLQISVRPGNSTEAYIPLTPRQPLAPTPYALHALTAATADTATNATNATTATNATQLGGLDASQFVTGAVVRNMNGLAGNVTLAAGANVTLTPAGNMLTIAAMGGGGGAFQWENITGAAAQAQSNRGYIANNNTEQVVVTLPAAPNVGDVVRVSGAGSAGWRLAQNAGQFIATISPHPGGFPAAWTPRLTDARRNWVSIASAAEGTKLAAVAGGEFIYTSTDSGQSWTPRLNDAMREWASIASSADGMRLIAVNSEEFIYTSTDAGATWTARTAAGSRRWSDVASSADGTKLVAVVSGGQIYTSTDAGATWTARESNRNWSSVASSANGTSLIAGESAGQLYTSTDSGETWMAQAAAASRNWRGVASSADGMKLVAVAFSGQIYTSTDAGGTWIARESNRAWTTIASSADGTTLIAGAHAGQLYVSTDAGANWLPRESDRSWRSAALSADGRKAVAGVIRAPALADPGYIFTAETFSTSTGVGGFLTGAQSTAVKLLYLGGGRFQMISSQGTVSVF